MICRATRVDGVDHLATKDDVMDAERKDVGPKRIHVRRNRTFTNGLSHFLATVGDNAKKTARITEKSFATESAVLAPRGKSRASTKIKGNKTGRLKR